MELVARIVCGPLILQIPVLGSDEDPFCFGGESVCITIGVKSIADEVRTVSARIENSFCVGVGCIESFAFAFGVGKKNRIKEGDVGDGNFIIFTRKLLGKLAKITARNFMLVNRKIVGELGDHFLVN